MSKTLLAVDDSATMRKVCEITFSGENFRVVTAEGREGALAKASETPDAVLIDTQLGADDGYVLCKELRQRLPNAVLVLLTSRYAPYDQTRGRDAGADDYADKPFDTQQMLDKVRKALVGRESTVVAQPAAAAPSAAPGRPPPPPAPGGARPVAPPLAAPTAPPAAPAKPTQPSMSSVPHAPPPPANRSQTLMFGHNVPAPARRAPDEHTPPPPVAAAPPPPPARPGPAASTVAREPSPPAPPVVTGGPAHVASAVNGELAPGLRELGLSPAQTEAVLALSRDVIERVVWEVVPQLAETLIKEEIDRLMKA